ncbi:galactokinase [bacterium]|nr:galactokinase [bacterium]
MQDLERRFFEAFGKASSFRAAAPGRVNLIGEHTDYNDGYVLPVAIQFSVTVLASPRTDGRVNLVSADFDSRVSFSLDEPLIRDASAGWSDYPKGVMSEFLQAGLRPCGMDAVYRGDVPIASGLSSSAAVETAFAVLIRRMNGFAIGDTDLARLCQAAENRFVGMNCGIMDQFISALGQANAALFLDCRSLGYEIVPFPSDLYDVVILNTRKKRELTGSEYNERRSQCEEGVRLLSGALPGIRALRDVSTAEFERHAPGLPETVRRRCRHVVEEDQRVLDFVTALRSRDEASIGRLLLESHASLRDLYEVSCPELDAMVDIAMSVPGTVGARMTGAGFGGCAVAVVRRGTGKALAEAVLEEYPKRTGLCPELYETRPSEGARAEKLE